MDDEAVSPVIGVIMMVAITVIVFGAAAVWLDSISDPPERAPNISFTKRADGAILEKAPLGLDWVRDFTRLGTCTPLLNGAAWPTTEGTPLTAADRISGCNPGEDFILSHTSSGNLVFKATF